MLLNYLHTALRALRRNWNYTVINVVGLTFGLACCLVLFLTIRYELSYDRHHVQADRTHRLITFYKKAVGIALLTVSFQSVKAALMNPVKSLRSE